MENPIANIKVMDPMLVPEREARSWGNENQPVVYCPKPRHANQHLVLFDTLNKSGANLNRDCNQSEIEFILCQDEAESDSGFFCGSPPVRTNNPLIHDSIFLEKLNSHFAVSLTSSSSNSSPSVNSESFTKKPRLEAGSPSSLCGVTSSYKSSPKLRVEGFAVIVSTI
ncbi:hypothetical protein LUZ62_076466 [Rhynchospora pubera]|uniref:Uncharacterized protein n=1 Tax=Rhynchospora pubera TaxID=906938 RepID=A0AAV8DIG4_9POAL|nr:hypothetical protein LUZ62_076466 [Rhynchospora pubera]